MAKRKTKQQRIDEEKAAMRAVYAIINDRGRRAEEVMLAHDRDDVTDDATYLAAIIAREYAPMREALEQILFGTTRKGLPKYYHRTRLGTDCCVFCGYEYEKPEAHDDYCQISFIRKALGLEDDQ